MCVWLSESVPQPLPRDFPWARGTVTGWHRHTGVPLGGRIISPLGSHVVRARPRTRIAARVTALAGGLVVGASALIITQMAGAGPAGAVGGVVLVSSGTASNSEATKTHQTTCPAGKVVVGGGAFIITPSGPSANKVRLIELRPVHPGGGPDGYLASAQEVGASVPENWSMVVNAVCADPVRGLHLVSTSGRAGSATVQPVEARCPTGEVALGGGALVRNAGFQADLRTVAPSPNGDRFTVQGGEDVDGYAANWSVNAYAMCAPTPPGYQVVALTGQSNPTDPRKAQSLPCPAGKKAHGAGAATSPTAPGGVGLEQLLVQNDLVGAQALAVMTQPVTVDWGPLRVFAICAN
jgi:hypothetical protein